MRTSISLRSRTKCWWGLHYTPLLHVQLSSCSCASFPFKPQTHFFAAMCTLALNDAQCVQSLGVSLSEVCTSESSLARICLCSSFCSFLLFPYSTYYSLLYSIMYIPFTCQVPGYALYILSDSNSVTNSGSPLRTMDS